MGLCQATGIKWLLSSAGSCGIPEKSSQGSATFESVILSAFLSTTSGTEAELAALIIDVSVFGVTGDALLRSSFSISDLGDALSAESKSSDAEFSLSAMIFLREAIQRYEESFHPCVSVYFAPHVQQLMQSINDVKGLVIVSLDRFHTTIDCLFNKNSLFRARAPSLMWFSSPFSASRRAEPSSSSCYTEHGHQNKQCTARFAR